jgi:hypothetical protein
MDLTQPVITETLTPTEVEVITSTTSSTPFHFRIRKRIRSRVGLFEATIMKWQTRLSERSQQPSSAVRQTRVRLNGSHCRNHGIAFDQQQRQTSTSCLAEPSPRQLRAPLFAPEYASALRCKSVSSKPPCEAAVQTQRKANKRQLLAW